MDLHLVITKGASFHPQMMKKTIFKIIGNFSETAFNKIPVKSPILQISEDVFFLFFLICYIMKTKCQLKCIEKKSFKKT